MSKKELQEGLESVPKKELLKMVKVGVMSAGPTHKDLDECAIVFEKDHLEFRRMVGEKIKLRYRPLGTPIVYHDKLFLALTKRKF